MHDIQKKILRLAKKDDIAQYGYRKLGDKVGVDHPQKVKWHLTKLLKDGKLIKDNAGNIRVPSKDDSFHLAKVPILGLANCGEPLAFADNTIHDYLTVSPSLLKKSSFNSIFAVQATGDSMNACSVAGMGIDDGDYAIVDGSKLNPNTGDIVVSSVEGLANVKKFVRDDENNVIALVSESTRPRPPIVIDQSQSDSYRVHGTVVGVIKSYA